MQQFIQTAIFGLGAGALDALLALGIVLVYRTTGVLNFAQAATGTFSAYVVYSVAPGRPLWLAIGAGILAGAFLGVVTFEIVGSIRTEHIALTSAVATLAIAILIQQAIRINWGSNPTGSFPTPFGFSAASVDGITITYLTIASLAVAAALAVLVGVLLRWTRVGTMVRALADNPASAALCGGNVRLLVAGVWAVGGALAAAGGFFAAQAVFYSSFLDPYFVAALIAAVIGGLRSLSGAFFGALALEVAYTVFQTYAPTNVTPYAETFLVLLLIALLALAPRRWLAQGGQRLV
jgi:branched-chain amino acid transport system permease protein